MKKLTILLWVMTKKGNQFEVELPAKREVCHRCDGTGKHVNPNIDGDGLTAEDLSDPDFRESYMSGVYDVRCHECKGERVVSVLNWDALTPKMRARRIKQENHEEQGRWEAHGERMCGA